MGYVIPCFFNYVKKNGKCDMAHSELNVYALTNIGRTGTPLELVQNKTIIKQQNRIYKTQNKVFMGMVVGLTSLYYLR